MNTKPIRLERAGVWLNSNGSGSEINELRAMKVEIKKPSRVIGSPVESGQTSFDNKVLDPTQVVVTGFIPVDSEYKFAMSRINGMYRDRSWRFYYASDGANSVGSLILKDLKTARDTRDFDLVNVELIFVEAMFISGEKRTASNEEDSDTRNHGYSQGVNF